jgi:predicted O-methyltransferase YrrM
MGPRGQTGTARKGLATRQDAGGGRNMQKRHGVPGIIFVSVIVVMSLSLNPQVSQTTQAAQQPHADREIYKQEYQFSSDWFTYHIRVWEPLLTEFKDKADVRYLEIGVFEGRSALWMLENILTHPSARLTAIDLFPDDLQSRFVANIDKSGFRDKVEIFKGKSQDKLRELPLKSYDLIYIDGSHRAKHVFLDAALSWDLLKDGGLLIFDDYLWNIELPADLIPKRPIDTFLMAFGDEIELLYHEDQVVVRKSQRSCERYICSTIGQYGYDWRQRALYELSTDKPVHLAEDEKAALEQFLMSYVDFRLNQRELVERVQRNEIMRKLHSRLAFFPQPTE